MSRTISALAATGLTLGLVVAVSPTASAEERTCRGSLGASTLDNVRCHLHDDRDRPRGHPKVERGGTLKATRIRVNGNVQAEDHRSVTLTWSTVGGSVQLKQGGAISLRSNGAKGDVQLFTNGTGTGTVSSNRIDGNLQCTENRPAPVGSGNVVDGNKEDQCRRL